MKQTPSWEANRSSSSQEIPAFYGNRRLITAFTRASHLSLSRSRAIQSMLTIPLLEDPEQFSPCSPSHFLKIHFTVTLPSIARASKCPLLLKFPNQNPVPIRATCTTHFIVLDMITPLISGEEHKLCSLLDSRVTRLT